MLAAALLPLFILIVCATAAPSWTSTPLEPAAIPLAVRSPYLSAWLAGGNELSGRWAAFWTGSILGWAGYARVDGVLYRTMGHAATAGAKRATQKSVTITASTTEFVLQAGGVDIVYTFLSPVEPGDLARQSLPFAYMSVGARSADGAEHRVEVYADVTAEWVAANRSRTVDWSFERSLDGGVLAHKVQLAEQETYAEVSDRIEHGSLYFATTSSARITYAQGPAKAVRASFASSGRLRGALDTNARPIGKDWPVFAFASALGAVSFGRAGVPVVFALGHVRQHVVNQEREGEGERVPFWMTRWDSAIDAITFFLHDYDRALVASARVDDSLQTHGAAAGGDHYVALLRLSLRQALAALEITVSRRDDGALDAEDVLVFMKDMSAGGVRCAETPSYRRAYGPQLGKHLLEPLLRYQAAGLYPNPYAAPDLGAHYPNATGASGEPMPVDASGAMLVMALSYAQRAGDTGQIVQYLDLLDGWAAYLAQHALVPAAAGGRSADDLDPGAPLANRTNVAVKGIIGVAAMGEIARMVGKEDKAARYTSLAKEMVTRWRVLAVSKDQSHIKLTYGSDESWGLVYNLYADRLLGLGLFSQDVYDMQTKWYKQQMGSYGVPLDSRRAWTRSDWELSIAATSDAELRGALVDAVHRYASRARGGAPLGDLYESDRGTTTAFRARAAVGGHFAILALQNNTLGSGTGTGAEDGSGGGGNGIDDDLNGAVQSASLSRSFFVGTFFAVVCFVSFA